MVYCDRTQDSTEHCFHTSQPFWKPAVDLNLKNKLMVACKLCEYLLLLFVYPCTGVHIVRV